LPMTRNSSLAALIPLSAARNGMAKPPALA
jgi:hypothetical protein